MIDSEIQEVRQERLRGQIDKFFEKWKQGMQFQSEFNRSGNIFFTGWQTDPDKVMSEVIDEFIAADHISSAPGSQIYNNENFTHEDLEMVKPYIKTKGDQLMDEIIEETKHNFEVYMQDHPGYKASDSGMRKVWEEKKDEYIKFVINNFQKGRMHVHPDDRNLYQLSRENLEFLAPRVEEFLTELYK